MPIKVLLVDDNDVVRRVIRGLLEQHPEIELVGEATGFAQTIQMTNDLKPHVIVLDLHLKDETTFTPADFKSHLNGCAPRIVAISLWNDEETRELAESFGAVTLLDKMELSAELIPIITESVGPASLDV